MSIIVFLITVVQYHITFHAVLVAYYHDLSVGFFANQYEKMVADTVYYPVYYGFCRFKCWTIRILSWHNKNKYS